MNGPVRILVQEFKTAGTIKAGGCKSMMIKNTGTSNVLLWGTFPLNVGDPALSLPGYDDGSYRDDEITFTFTPLPAVGPSLHVFFDIDVNCPNPGLPK